MVLYIGMRSREGCMMGKVGVNSSIGRKMNCNCESKQATKSQTSTITSVLVRSRYD